MGLDPGNYSVFDGSVDLSKEVGTNTRELVGTVGLGVFQGEFLYLGSIDVAVFRGSYNLLLIGLGLAYLVDLSVWLRIGFWSFAEIMVIHRFRLYQNQNFCQVACFERYVFDVMHKFSKNRILLLQELQSLVNENLTREHEFVTHDIRRYNRKLKAMRQTIKEWMLEMVNLEKLKEAERCHNEELRKQAEAAHSIRMDCHQ